jgi:hypothetical protein
MSNETRTLRRFALALPMFAIVAAGCDSSPTVPTPVPTPSPSTFQTPPVRLSGRVVDSAGRSVVDARVTLMSPFAPRTGADTVSDAAGVYALTVPGWIVSTNTTVSVTVEGDGFEFAHHSVWLGEDPPAEVTRDLRLHRLIRVNAGGRVEVPIGEGDPSCGVNLDWYPCRRVRIVAPASGTLVAELSPGDYPRFVVTSAGGFSGAPTLRVRVDAGSETLLDVVLVADVPATTSLRTRLE